jgi:hypothetical protein
MSKCLLAKMTFLLLSLLAAELFVPPIMLSRYEEKMSWRSRYFLAILPAVYTWALWKMRVAAYDF